MAHYYSRNGDACHFQETKAGGSRSTSTRDAKKQDLLPGVTTILTILDKPQIKEWLINEHIKAAYAIKNQDLCEDVFKTSVKALASQKSDEAKTKGSNIHAQIEQYLKGEEVQLNRNLVEMLARLKEICGELKSEVVLVGKDYAGKCDAMNENFIVDFKTQRFKDGEFSVYDEWIFQTCAYSMVLEYPVRLISVVINSDEPHESKIIEWDRDAIEWGCEVFNNLKVLYYLTKWGKYDCYKKGEHRVI